MHSCASHRASMHRYVRFASPVTLFLLVFVWTVALNDGGATSHLLLIVTTSTGLGALGASTYLRGESGRSRPWALAGSLIGGLLVGLCVAGKIIPAVAYTAAFLPLAVLAGVGVWYLLRDDLGWHSPDDDRL